ncbi:protein-tyrosine sulfotransferase 2-like [Centruroides sculpturatus]|uniref:protein-tyrosine sulfotransferase 2-like n=1 Tax=Centruroides sculpturatus TaxID=218467 RepID=UPI000C6CDC5E|nr:protein-tyrosine sulfotransferase 2-like [Centruroides sculpturatus]XP_023214978.1 protein-tyrosine sulfotransferase 2-like [Centruroides sculpturatus]XP_023214979.1 protein-tyrosine sulfotransferase 2-like [Centruroides sculpturatus]XP_023214980.1 protein-tyrosine sulfotransferase 2-like [Centruroides sculpturatus]XP_023214982.1 protein-tyrosine sulfotransferase 2-like [Centruroides sculpturatus]
MGGRWARKYLVLLAVLGCIGLLFLYYSKSPCISYDNRPMMLPPQKYIVGPDNKKYVYDRNMQLIFIGGMPRSGTTLLRVLLDAHPDIRCGEETRVIPRLLSIKQQWLKAPIEYKRLQEAGITGEVLDNAVAAFILEIIARHGEPAPRLCNKDPFTLRSAVYLNSLFPRAKYILLIRDGRAVVHSIITRKVTITGFDLTDYRQCLKKWNVAMQAMYYQCQQLGPKICYPVYYEQLVLHPKQGMEKILEFLEVPWNDSVLHHEDLVDKPGGISLSKLERSTDQVIKPINLEALSKWVGNIPEDVVRDMANIAPMLAVLGYDPNGNPPNYGKPDSFVLRNTKEIVDNQVIWAEKEKKLIEEREKIRKQAVQNKVKDLSSSTDNVEHFKNISSRLAKLNLLKQMPI